MNIFRTSIITIIALTMAPIALAQVYKCDGPDGPVYSDRKCEADASTVKISESSGMTGVDDKTKADLAQSKLEREQAVTPNSDGTVINNQTQVLTIEDNERGVRGRNQAKDRIDSGPATPLKQKPAPKTSKRKN